VCVCVWYIYGGRVLVSKETGVPDRETKAEVQGWGKEGDNR